VQPCLCCRVSADPGVAVRLCLVPANISSRVLARYALASSNSTNSTSGTPPATRRRLLQAPAPSPAPVPAGPAPTPLLDYDSSLLSEPPAPEVLAGAVNASNATAADAGSSSVALPTGTLIGSLAFDVPQPDAGWLVQDRLPLEPGVTTVSGELDWCACHKPDFAAAHQTDLQFWYLPRPNAYIMACCVLSCCVRRLIQPHYWRLRVLHLPDSGSDICSSADAQAPLRADVAAAGSVHPKQHSRPSCCCSTGSGGSICCGCCSQCGCSPAPSTHRAGPEPTVHASGGFHSHLPDHDSRRVWRAHTCPG